MRILIVTQYFTPEITAASSRLLPIAKGLSDLGHQVEVICEVPNHPNGVIDPEFRGRRTQTRQFDGITVKYIWVKTSEVKTTRSRLIFYASYAAMASVVGSGLRRPDVILTSSPPLPAAAAARLIAAVKRVPWVMDVRDPWPEAAVALGELSDERVIGALERLERHLYKSASAIITVTEPFRVDIASKVSNPEKITIIPNGTTRFWLDIGASEVSRADLDMPGDRFVLTYAGNIGIAQGLKPVVEAAGRIDAPFQLQLIGDGPVVAELKEMASRLPADRVVFRGLVAPEKAARYLRASDANLVPLGAAPGLSKFVPSKLFDCCAVGRPVILSALGEPVRLAASSNAVLPIAPEDPDALCEAIARLRADPGLVESLSRQGRAFAADYLREDQIGRLAGVLEGVVRDKT